MPSPRRQRAEEKRSPRSPRAPGLALLLLVAVVSAWAPGQVAEAQFTSTAEADAPDWEPVPFRVRNLTLPTVLVMGFRPSPVMHLAPRSWAMEIDFAMSNSFQMSAGVEEYLAGRGGSRRPLNEADVQAVVHTAEGDQFLVDGELAMVDVGLHCGLTDELVVSLHVSHVSFGGGALDPVIWGFHDLLGIGQGGRQYVSNDSFQMVFANDDGTTAFLARPSNGGFTDPMLSVRWIMPSSLDGWRFGVEGGLKSPLASSDDFLSTGSWDFGAQLTAQREWTSNAVVINLALVVPGALDIAEHAEVARLPSLNLAWVNRVGDHTSGVVQMLFSQNIFHEMTDSDLSELEFQLTAGLAWDTSMGRFSVGVTENLFNFDNTPDFALHLNFAHLFGRP